MAIYSMENTHDIGKPIRVYDVYGNHVEDIVWCNTETGEVVKLSTLRDSNSKYVRTKQKYKAPLRVEYV